MSVEAKKSEIVRLILALQDESVMDSLLNILSKLTPNKNNQQPIEEKEEEFPFEKYRHDPNLEFDLERIMKEQNYTGLHEDKWDDLIKEADIQEPIEELLAMLTK